MQMEWEVVAGADKGGILVRAGRDTKSPEYPQRLAFGARVRQLELHGDRMYFQKIKGLGPDIGWVSTRLKDKDLLKRILPASRAERASVRQSLEQQMQYQPHMREQFQAIIKAMNAADAEEDERLGASRAQRAPAAAPAPKAKAPAAKASRAELQSMSTRQLLARASDLGATEDELDAMDEKTALIEFILNKTTGKQPEQVGQALPSMDELMQSMDGDDDEVMDAPAPAAVEVLVAAGEVDERYEERIPSIDELLGKIDDEEVAAPPSLEEMLKALDNDEKEQAEFEENLSAQQSFWNMGSLKGNSLAERLMIEDDNKSKRGVEALNAIQHDSAPRVGTFSYNDIYKFGDICMQRNKEAAESGEHAALKIDAIKVEPPSAEAQARSQAGVDRARAAREAEKARKAAALERVRAAKAAGRDPAAGDAAKEENEVEEMDDAAFLASLGLSADGANS